MSERLPPVTPPRLVLNFTQPMRPKARGRVKIIPGRELPQSGDTLAFPERYAPTPAERGDEG